MRFVIGLIVLSAILRIVHINDCALIDYDGTYYLRYFNWDGPFPPGYPLLVEVGKLFADEIFVARAISSLFGILLIIPTFYVLKRYSSLTVTVVLTTIVAVHPVLMRVSLQELSDVPYIFFWMLGFLFYKQRPVIAIVSGSVAYLIRPEGLLLAAFVTVSLFFTKKYHSGVVGLAVMGVIVGGFVLYNYQRTGDLTVSSKMTNQPVFSIENWRANELTIDKPASWDEFIENTINDGPTRLKVLGGYILQVSGWPIVLVGLIGLVENPSIYWIILPQFLMMAFKGGNYSLRYAFPYFIVLLIGVALASRRFDAKAPPMDRRAKKSLNKARIATRPASKQTSTEAFANSSIVNVH